VKSAAEQLDRLIYLLDHWRGLHGQLR